MSALPRLLGLHHMGVVVRRLATSACRTTSSSSSSSPEPFVVDLRSDTLTTPTKPMLHAMMNATWGDDVFNEDPTIHSE
jgi:hypothetical protein